MTKVKIGDRVKMINDFDNALKGETGLVIGTFNRRSDGANLVVLFDNKDWHKHAASGFSADDESNTYKNPVKIKPYPDREERFDRCHYVPDSAVEVLKSAVDEFSKLVIYTEHNKVIAKLLNGKRTVAEGVAKCAPSDDFNFLKGAQIAMQRCMAKASNTPITVDGEVLKQLGITTTL